MGWCILVVTLMSLPVMILDIRCPLGYYEGVPSFYEMFYLVPLGKAGAPTRPSVLPGVRAILNMYHPGARKEGVVVKRPTWRKLPVKRSRRRRRR